MHVQKAIQFNAPKEGLRTAAFLHKTTKRELDKRMPPFLCGDHFYEHEILLCTRLFIILRGDSKVEKLDTS